MRAALLSPEAFADLQRSLASLPADLAAYRLEKLTRSHADDVRVWFLLGVARHRLDRLDAALAAFEHTLMLAPAYLPAISAKAGMLAALGRGREATDLLVEARRQHPGDADIVANLGYLVEQQVGERQQALECYDAALRIAPGHREALMNRGALLLAMGRLPEAIENNRQLTLHHPRLAAAHYNLAQSLLVGLQSEEAIAAASDALAIDAALPKAHMVRGLALAELGRLQESGTALARARVLDPSVIDEVAEVFERHVSGPPLPADPLTLYLHRGFRHLASADWLRRETFLKDFERRVDRLLAQAEPILDYSLAYSILASELPPTLHRGLMENLSGSFEALAREQRPIPRVYRRGDSNRIRIGYVSPDFREHLNARLTLPIFRLHDRNRFEVVCYSLQEDDGSAIRRDIEAAADGFVDVSMQPLAEIADRIHADGVDILVDLAGVTRMSKPEVFAFRPAPVQVSYLGFPGTLGASYIDYRISDRIATPGEQRGYWSERLAFLPDTFYIYDEAEPLAPVPLCRKDYGLPETGAVFCAFHNPYKIDPGIFDAWMRILGRVPGSVLWLSGADAIAIRNLRQEARRRGIDVQRLLFMPVESRERYRARFALADLYLDARFFTAMTTACDALMAGLPLITSPGGAFPSRVSASLLAAMNLQECVLPDLGAYEDEAVRLALDPASLQDLRVRVAARCRTTPLFDSAARVRELEAAYAIMWQRYLGGLSPTDFDVPR